MRAPLRALPLSSGDICSLRCKRTPIVTVVTVQRVVCQSFSPRLIPPFLISEKHLNRYCVARLHKMCLQPAWKTKSNQWSYKFHHFEKSPKCSTSLSLDIRLIFIWFSSEASFAIQKTGSAHFVGGMYAAVYMWRPLRMGFGLLSCTNQPVSWNQNLDPKNEDPWAFTETGSL